MASKKTQRHRAGSGGEPHSDRGSQAPAEISRTSPETATGGWVIPAARVLLAVAAVMAAYLAWNSFSGGSLPGCGPASGCDKVLQSRWAYWLGVPVSVPALLVYLGLLIESFSIRGKASNEQQRRAWLLIVGLSVVVIGAALWFVGLQVFLLKSFCRFCMTAHASGLIAGLLLLRSAPFASDETVGAKHGDDRAIPSRLGFMLVCLGGLGVVALAGGQVLIDRPVSAVKTAKLAGLSETTNVSPATAEEPRVQSAVSTNLSSMPRLEATTNPPPNPTPSSAEAAKPVVRELLLHSGKFRLRLDELPMIGSVQAPNVIVNLFDYTCHYCRELHGLLLQAQQRFSNELAVVSLPMPLDATCNHLVKRTLSAHQRACEYAALGLAVWRAQPESFHQFDNWLFAPASPPSVGEAKQFADNLVGQAKLEQALTEGWVANQIQTDISIYDANSRQLGNDRRMPQLIIGSTVNAGPMARIDELYRLLSDHLGLRVNP